MEVITTYKRKPALVMDGYRYRAHRTADTNVWWRCVNERKQKCKGSLKTTADNQVIRATPHQCLPNFDQQEIQKAIHVCKKRAQEELDTPVPVIFKEEFAKVTAKGIAIPKYDSAKTMLCHARRRALGTSKKVLPSPRSEAGESEVLQSTEVTNEIFKLPNPVRMTENSDSWNVSENIESPRSPEMRETSEVSRMTQHTNVPSVSINDQVPRVRKSSEVGRSTETAEVSPLEVLTPSLEDIISQVKSARCTDVPQCSVVCSVWLNPTMLS